MEKIIEIDLYDKEDLVEKYNSKIVSKNLIDYTIEQAMFVGKNDTIKVIVNNQCNFDENCLEIIKNGLQLEYQKKLRNRYLNSIKQFVLLMIGVLFIFLSAIVEDNFIFKEVFLIIGWVPIWECIDIELFTDIPERRTRRILNKLLESNFEMRR